MKASLLSHGGTHVLVGVGITLLFASVVGRLGENSEARSVYGILLALAVTAGVVGALAMGAARSVPQKNGARWVLRIARAYILGVLLLGILFVLLHSISEGSLDLAGAGILWVLAALLGGATTFFWRPGGGSSGLLGGALAVAAAALFTIGHAVATSPALTPFQHWVAIDRFFIGTGVLGGAAITVAAVSAVVAPLVDRGGGLLNRLGVAVGAALYGVATLRPSVDLLTGFEWDLLATPSSYFGDEPLLAVSLYFLVGAFTLWTVAAALTLLAAAAVLVTDGRRAYSSGLLRFPVRGARAAGGPGAKDRREGRPTIRRMECPKCGAATEVNAEERPVCPACWYTGPQ